MGDDGRVTTQPEDVQPEGGVQPADGPADGPADAPVAPVPARPTNLPATASVFFGLIGTILAPGVLNAGGIVQGVAGLILACVGISRAVRLDYALARALTGLSLSFLAVVVWVFARGMT